MQTIWSRVAQTRGTCSCPQCLQIVHGISKRATASATRRTPKFLYSSTLFYSGIFAAAATWDAGVKKKRREQWDRAIADIKQELRQTADSLSVEELKDVLAEQPTEDKDIFRPFGGTLPWPVNTGPELNVHRLPPESLWATEGRKTRAETRKWSPKKMETTMLAMDLLQLQIFHELQHQDHVQGRREVAEAVPAEYRERVMSPGVDLQAAIKGKIEDLRRIHDCDYTLPDWSRSAGDIPLCQYYQDGAGEHSNATRCLNDALYNLFTQSAARELSASALLAKIAYNLSSSTTPPNLDTFNTLLVGLSQSGQNRMFNNVIRHLRRTHTRPNEITYQTVLDHFTKTGDAKNFVFWVELMRGKHRGLALAREDIHINAAGASRLLKLRRRDKPARVIQLPYPTPLVFGALIRGVLRFSGFDTALEICSSLGHEGWGLCMNGLTPLLVDCADRRDWSSGLAVWQQLQALKERSVLRQKPRERWKAEQINVEAYAAMLRLCMQHGEKDVYESTWDEAVNARVASPDMLVGVVKSQMAAIGSKQLPPAQTDVGDLVPEECTYDRSWSERRLGLGYEDSEAKEATGTLETEVTWAEESGDFVAPPLPIEVQAQTKNVGHLEDVALRNHKLPDVPMLRSGTTLDPKYPLGRMLSRGRVDEYDVHQQPMSAYAG